MAGSISFGAPPTKYTPAQIAAGKIPLQQFASGNQIPPPGPSAQDIANQQARQQAAQEAAQAAAQKAADDQARAAGFDQQIAQYQYQLGLGTGQLSAGNANIDQSYNTAFNQLAQTKARSQTGYDTAGAQALQDYNTGRTQNQNAYDTTSQQSLQDFNTAKTNATNQYNTIGQQSRQDYVGAKNTIGANAGSSLNSLLRLLGSRGAGGGSAAQFAAPQAVARGASIQRGEVGQTFGRNQQALDTNYNLNNAAFDTNYGRNKNALDTNFNLNSQLQDTAFGRNRNALDTNWQNYLSDYGNSVTDIGNQRTNQQNNLQSTVYRQQSDILNQLANTAGQRANVTGLTPGAMVGAAQPYYNQANDLLSRSIALNRGVDVPLTARPASYNAPALAPPPGYNPPALEAAPAYTPPDISQYIVNPNAAPTVQGQPVGNDYFSPYLAALTGKKQLGIA